MKKLVLNQKEVMFKNLCGCNPKPKNNRLWCDNHMQVTFGLGLITGAELMAVLIILFGNF